MTLTRRHAREWAIQLLFQLDYNTGPVSQAFDSFWRDKTAPRKLQAFAESLVSGVMERRDELDATIQGYAEHWDLKRMSGVDRNIIRLALHEMLHRTDIPPVVSINEAVEIAKRFSTPESGRFVNGILDRAKNDINRPDRSALATDEDQD